MLPQPVVLGYHGCGQALAHKVINGEALLRQSENDYDWLGHGIYFWISDSVRVWTWARQRAQKLNQAISQVAVVGAAIDLGNCLHLADSRATAYLKEAYDYLKQVSELEETRLPGNTGKLFSNRKLDCAVFESLHNLRGKRNLPPFDTVAAYFIEGSEVYPGAAIRALDHVQICVRNPAKILGLFMVQPP